MQAIEDTGVYAYRAGEEVVAVIRGEEVLDVGRGLVLAPESVPPWIIGRIVACVRRAGRPAYVLRYRYNARAHVWVVGAHAIEGVA